MSRDAALDRYFAEAASWDRDLVEEARRRARIVGWSAVGGWTCAIAASLALLMLVPLKRVDPYLIRVDSSTGIVDVVPTFTGNADLPEAVTRYFLDHYVTVCERFSLATAESDYEECGAFHTAARNQAWYQAWNTSNPSSPLNAYKDGTTIRAMVSAVTLFSRASGEQDLAQIRYVKARRQAGGGEEIRTHHIATLRYAFVEPAKDAKARRWNPLGFKVLEFMSEPEVLGEPALTGGAP